MTGDGNECVEWVDNVGFVIIVLLEYLKWLLYHLHDTNLWSHHYWNAIDFENNLPIRVVLADDALRPYFRSNGLPDDDQILDSDNNDLHCNHCWPIDFYYNYLNR